MIRWFFSKANGSGDEDDPRFDKAKKAQEEAERDHKEAVELIRLLEVEHTKNHYAELVESALASGRNNNGGKKK